MSAQLVEQSFKCIDALILSTEHGFRGWEISLFSIGRVSALASIDKLCTQRHFYGDRAAEFFCRLYFAKSKQPLSIFCIGTDWYDCLCKKDGKNVERGVELISYSKKRINWDAIAWKLLALRQQIPSIAKSLFGKNRWCRIDNYLSFAWYMLRSSNNRTFNHLAILENWRENPGCLLYIANCLDLVERAYELAIIYRCVIWMTDAALMHEINDETKMSLIAFYVPPAFCDRFEAIFFD